MKKNILDKKTLRENIYKLRTSFDDETLNSYSLNAQLNLAEFLKKKISKYWIFYII